MNESHRRAIATTLVLVDEVLQDLLRLADGEETRSVLYAELNTFAPDHRERLRTEAVATLAVLEQIRQALGLEPEIRDSRTLVWSRCAVLTDYMADLTEDRLERYGPADELPGCLARLLGEVTSKLEAIAELASRTPPGVQ